MNTDRLLTHFEQISDAPDAIPSLRRFIFDIAVRGKLVPKTPTTNPRRNCSNKFNWKRHGF